MRIPGVKRAKKFFRLLLAQVYGGALILGYHRISSTPGAMNETCVSPESFAEHLHQLRKYTYPISLSKLVNHLRDGSLPEKSIAVTFDDGYADNLFSAKPLLEKYEVPATIFVCTGLAGKEFWWDELERLVACARTDLHALHLQIAGKQFRWHPTNAHPKAGHPELREQFRRALYNFLLMLDIEEQNRAMDIIRSWSDVSAGDMSAARAMNQDELLQLVNGGLIELGAHTRHHSMLPQLSFERQKEEIESSKRDLESLLGKRIPGFAYPNGRATGAAKRIVQEIGFAYACTSLHDVVRPGNDLYELTRFWQKDVDGDSFVKGLNWWMSMIVRQ